MTKSKTTKRALLFSVLALVLCASMLIGSTFAWFTDSVVSGKNKIVAGNLDVKVEYNIPENGELTDWKPLDKTTDSLFKRNGKDILWEPGHTEYVVLRISNVGTLALKYTAKVDVVAETGSINMAGNPFKLSDYLYYSIEQSDTEPAGITRDSIVAKATQKLGAISTADYTLSAGDPEKYGYITLAITMPTTVDNIANYDKQYDAPYIDLGITVLATQYTEENDSFGNTYDKDAKYPLPTFTTTDNVQFPVKVPAELDETTGNYVADLEVKPTGSDKTYDMGTVTIPAERVDSANKPEVEINPTTADKGNFTVGDGNEAVFYEITVTNLKDGETAIPVELQLDKGLDKTSVKITHAKSATVTEDLPATYDPVTGIVSFETTSFSPFMIEYKAEKVAMVGGVYYSTLADALNAAKDGETIVLQKDIKSSDKLVDLPSKDKNLTIDLNGTTFTYTGTACVAQAYGGAKLTIKNGTIIATNTKAIGVNALQGATVILDHVNVQAHKNGVKVSGNSTNATISNCKINTTQEANAGVQVQNGATATLNNVNLRAENYGVLSSNATVEISNSDIITTDKASKGVHVQKGSTVTLDHVNVQGQYAGVVSSKSNVDITNCNIKAAIYDAVESLGDSTVTIKDSELNAKEVGVYSKNANNTIVIDNTTINSNYFGITQNGSTNPSSITVTNSTITDTYGTGIYISNTAAPTNLQTLKVENCTISAPTAIEVKHTDATITGCTLNATADKKTSKESGKGACTTGYAIAVTSNSNADKVVGAVTVTGCHDQAGADIDTADAFVFQTAEGVSVTIGDTVVDTFNKYGE